MLSEVEVLPKEESVEQQPPHSTCNQNHGISHFGGFVACVKPDDGRPDSSLGDGEKY